MSNEPRRIEHEEAERIALLRATEFGGRTAPDGLVASSAEVLAAGIRSGDMACFVTEADDVIVSYGIALIEQRLPAAHNPTGRWGWVQSMETHHDHRRRGHATRILQAIQAWYHAEGVPQAQLVATNDGEPLYQREGFMDEPFGHFMVWFAPTPESN